jgi:hypothetical protein
MIPFPFQIGGAGLLGAREAIGGWDPASIFNAGTLTDSNRLYTGELGSDSSHVRGLRAITGDVYFSGVLSGPFGNQGIGIARDGAPPATISDWVGFTSQSVGGWGSADGLYTNGSRIHSVSAVAWEFAVRASSGRVWARAAGGAWLGGGDPAADTLPTCTLTGTSDLRACATCVGDTSTARLHAASETTGTPPAGFSVGL